MRKRRRCRGMRASSLGGKRLLSSCIQRQHKCKMVTGCGIEGDAGANPGRGGCAPRHDHAHECDCHYEADPEPSREGAGPAPKADADRLGDELGLGRNYKEACEAVNSREGESEGDRRAQGTARLLEVVAQTLIKCLRSGKSTPRTVRLRDLDEVHVELPLI